jgi:DNA-binding response OmpR family regulator
MRVLLVEDDEHVASALGDALRHHGHEIVPTSSAAEAMAQVPGCDLVLLDLGLPDLDGIEVCKRLRKQTEVPIIIVTARADEVDTVLGLQAGADDYIVKPYSIHALRARIDAVTRRCRRCGVATGHDDPPSDPDVDGEHGGVLTVGPLSLNPRRREVTLDGRPVPLTRKEFDLLAMLMGAPDTVQTREAIIARVWDENWFGSTRTLDVHIGSVRQKLGSYGWVETTRGVGFRIGSPPACQPAS